MLLLVVGMYFPHSSRSQFDLRMIDLLISPSEMQLFLLGFIVIQICEIFTVGGIPLHDSVRKVSTEHNFFHIPRRSGHLLIL